MRRSFCVLVLASFLTGCVAHVRGEAPVDTFVPATVLPDPAPPREVVAVPEPVPMPSQLKPLPGGAATSRTPSAATTVRDANRAARMEPTPAGFVNAMQVFPYSPAALYQVYTMPGKVTDIALEPGEDLIDVSAPDTVRWLIGDTKSGSGKDERRHVIVKPTRVGLKSNLAIFTSRRAYHLELTATPATWMAAVSWDYPSDRLATLRTANEARQGAIPVAAGLALEQLAFRYRISGDRPPWRPLRAFDDHEKVYIQFPEGIEQTDLPPLFVLSADGKAELVNYHVRAPYYVVDRLFSAAELPLGDKHGERVRIERTDLSGKGNWLRRSRPDGA